jgi:serine/threonine protein phosphatase 1
VESRIIFLGDIVDPGTDSRGAMDLVGRTLKRWPSSRLLLGNHGDWFLQVMSEDVPDERILAHWLRHGGTGRLTALILDPRTDVLEFACTDPSGEVSRSASAPT